MTVRRSARNGGTFETRADMAIAKTSEKSVASTVMLAGS
jgi:hypothetical protein